jgi:hypothetical protein
VVEGGDAGAECRAGWPVECPASWNAVASLDGQTEPAQGPGWPQPRSYPVRECLLCILNEEWEHRLYAERT